MTPSRRLKLLCAILAAVPTFTATWIFIGLNNSGDAFPQGRAVVLQPLILVLPPLAAWMGWRGARRPMAIALAVLTALSLAWWALVPDGWWAVGPPGP